MRNLPQLADNPSRSFMDSTESALIAYRMRIIRTTVPVTAVMITAAIVYLMLSGFAGAVRLLFGFLIVAGVALGVLIRVLPWERMLLNGSGVRMLHASSAIGVILITLGIALTGGARSELFFLYGLSTVFFASVYSPVRQSVFILFTFCAYAAALTATGWDINPGVLVLRLTTLGTIAFITSLLSHELISSMKAQLEARAESERRSKLLSLVAGAGRDMTTLKPATVLEKVVEGALELGFDAANIGLFDSPTNTYRIVHHRGLPPGYAETVHPADTGAHGQVFKTRRTAILGDYVANPSAMFQLKEAGVKMVVSAPVWIQGELAATLSAASLSSTSPSPEEVEAIELLAAQAGRALENAQRFEREHEALQKMAEADRIKSDFVSNVSHELRTPLTVIEGMAATLKDRSEALDDSLKEIFLERIYENAVSLEEVITRLLDFSRIEAGSLEVKLEHFDVGDLVLGVLSRMASMIGADPVTRQIEAGMLVRADAALIERVLENLITNAVKHNQPGTPITVSVERSGRRVRVVVTDCGKGIPPEEVSRLGERFFRGGHPDQRETRGLGLGLALSKEILELHATRLGVTSKQGKGSSFWFELPLAPARFAAVKEAAAARRRAS